MHAAPSFFSRGPKRASLVEAWNRVVRADRHAPAWIDAATSRAWSRGDLDQAAEEWQTAHGKTAAGRPVIFSQANGVEWLRVFIGLLKAGAVAMPLDPGEPAAARAALAERFGVPLLWTGDRLESRPVKIRAPRDGRRLVKLTSGSTGVPRALAFTDAQMVADGRQVCAAMEIGAGDINFALIPFGHSYGLGNLIMPLLLRGTALAGGSEAFPQVMAAGIARTRSTVFPAVPALLRALAEAEIDPAQLQSLRTVISAGAPLAPEIARAFHARFGKKIHSFYGSSETGGISYDRTGEAALSGRSVGRPLPGVELAWERGGRFTVKSRAVFTLGNRRRADGRGMYRPADRALLDARGELVLLGRTGRLVKIAGRRLNLGEVEQALKRLPGVRDAWVELHAARAETLVAAVAGGGHAAGLREALREHLAAWKIPRKIVVLAEFPVTARGKTDLTRLRAAVRTVV